MRANNLLPRLRAGETLLGLANSFPAAGIIELIGRGWDFVWIDGQHGQFGYDAVISAVRAADLIGVESILRVPGHEYGIIGPMADLAPSALMVPMVNNAQEARAVASATHFPPLGMRSYGGRRLSDLYGREYYRERESAVVAQIETVEAVENAEAIINTPGIDVLFFSFEDLKVQMGLPISSSPLTHPDLRAAMEKTVRAATRAGKFAGCIMLTAASVAAAKEMGYRLIVGGGDVVFLRAAEDRLKELREAPAPPGNS